MSHLNFENSNFQNSQYDSSAITFSRFTDSNFAHTRINDTRFVKNIMTNVNFNKAIILRSSFKYCDLQYSIFDNATIIDSAFIHTNLIGVDFSKVEFLYDNTDQIKKNFSGSIYNSRPITISGEYNKNPENAANYCALHQTKYSSKTCIEAILKITESSETTQFPSSFDPKKYNLIDASDFMEFLKQSTNST